MSGYRMPVGGVLILSGMLAMAVWNLNVAVAGTYYVSPDGNDALPCAEAVSIDHPRQTIQEGLACLTAPGDTLRIREGTYLESVTIDSEAPRVPRGSSWESPVTIAAYEDEQVVLQPGSDEAVIGLSHPAIQYVIFEGLILDATNMTHGVRLNGDAHHVRLQHVEIQNATRHAIETSYAESHDFPPSFHEFLHLDLHDNGTRPNQDHTLVLGTSHNLVGQSHFSNNAGAGVMIRKTDSSRAPDANILQYNSVFAPQGEAKTWGIRLEDGAGTTVYNNLVVGYPHGMLVEGTKTTGSWVVHNTIVGPGEVGIRVKKPQGVAGIHNNLVSGFTTGLDVAGGTAGLVSANVFGGPHFVDEARHDFRLHPTSPAINAGLDLRVPLAQILPGEMTDLEGQTRPFGAGWDIGAYEFSGPLSSPPVAAFTASVTSGAAPLLTSFFDASVGDVTAWVWNFGDGSVSPDRHPTHQYASSGTYTVSLSVSGPGGSHVVTAPQMIVVSPSAPTVDFTATPVTGTVPVDVAFTNTSTGDATEWMWDFGDGASSTDRSPLHRFSSPGTFTVRLSGSGPLGSDEEMKSAYLSLRPSLGITLLQESFDSGFFADWQVVDEGLWQSPSSWLVLTGSLAQVSNIWSPPADPAEIAKLGTYVWYAAGVNWTNYVVNVTLRSEDDDALGIMVRYQDPDNYYRFSWDREGRYRRLVKKVEGVFTLLAEESVPYMPGEPYAVEILAYDDSLDVHVNGASIFGGSVHDADLAHGSIGLYSWFNNKSVFDDVQVTEVTRETGE